MINGSKQTFGTVVPNGNVAGNLGDFYFNTASGALTAWFCYIAGTASTAEWGIIPFCNNLITSTSNNAIPYFAGGDGILSEALSVNNSILTTGAMGIPTFATILPAGLTIPQPIIQGITSGSTAASGVVGEFISSVVLSTSAISLTSSAPKNITSIALSAGDWDVFGNYNVLGITTTTSLGWSSITSATIPDAALYSTGGPFETSGGSAAVIPTMRYNVSIPTTVFLSVNAIFTSGGSACGGIYARRRR
jgi:hypothetical protein